MVKPSSSNTPASSPTENGLDNNNASNNSSSSSCKYKGVRKRKWGKYVSEIRLPNSRERIWLGSYDSAEKAAKAFDAALFCLRGRDAKFNFPDNPPDIVQGRSLNPQEIQAVAARFANNQNNNNNNNVIISSSSNESHNNNNVGSMEQLYTPTTSSSVSLSDGGVPTTMQVESSEMMDWTSFLSMLDTNQEMSTSGYGFYPGLYPPPPPPDDVDDDDDQNGGDAFSQSSFLWNF